MKTQWYEGLRGMERLYFGALIVAGSRIACTAFFTHDAGHALTGRDGQDLRRVSAYIEQRRVREQDRRRRLGR